MTSLNVHVHTIGGLPLITGNPRVVGIILATTDAWSGVKGIPGMWTLQTNHTP